MTDVMAFGLFFLSLGQVDISKGFVPQGLTYLSGTNIRFVDGFGMFGKMRNTEGIPHIV